MARKPSEASHSSDAGQELNLAPIMGLLVILIPMLLAMFNFFEVKVQAVAAPKLGTGSSKKSDDQKKPLNLTVLISKTGFQLKQESELQTEPEKPILRDTFTITTKDSSGAASTITKEDYDYPALYSRLAAKKRAYPDETTINIAAEMDIPWYVIARTIDASRIELEEGDFSGPDRMTKYSAAKPRMRQSKKDVNQDNKVDEKDLEPVPMFSRVVFVVAE